MLEWFCSNAFFSCGGAVCQICTAISIIRLRVILPTRPVLCVKADGRSSGPAVCLLTPWSKATWLGFLSWRCLSIATLSIWEYPMLSSHLRDQPSGKCSKSFGLMVNQLIEHLCIRHILLGWSLYRHISKHKFIWTLFLFFLQPMSNIFRTLSPN